MSKVAKKKTLGKEAFYRVSKNTKQSSSLSSVLFYQVQQRPSLMSPQEKTLGKLLGTWQRLVFRSV